MKSEAGFALLESIVVMVLFAILAIGVISSASYSIYSRGRANRVALAMQEVIYTLESYAAIDPATLSDTNDSSGTVTLSGHKFTKVVDVTVNADNSRTISVSLTGQNGLLDGYAMVTNTLPLWGSQ